MASIWESVAFDHEKFKVELNDFRRLLQDHSELSERDIVQPFFKARKHLTAYIGTLILNISVATEVCYEFDLASDFRADIILGSKAAGQFCVVEFEPGTHGAIFKKQPKRKNPEWSSRFEHAFSQIVDWFYCLEDQKNTAQFRNAFGSSEVSFASLIVMGRLKSLTEAAKNRLTWRTKKVLIDSNRVTCITFDELYDMLSDKYKLYNSAAKIEP